MGGDLEAKITERKKEAIEKELEYKVRTIAVFLGSGTSYDDPRDTAGRNFQFRRGKFLVKDYFHCLPERGMISETDVIYLGRVVYQSRQKYRDLEIKIISYIPGEWEDEFNNLYIEALKVKEQKAEAEQKVESTSREQVLEEAELRAKWGL